MIILILYYFRIKQLAYLPVQSFILNTGILLYYYKIKS